MCVFKLFGKPLGWMVFLMKNNNLATKECVLLHSFHQRRKPIHFFFIKKSPFTVANKDTLLNLELHRAQCTGVVRHAYLPSLSQGEVYLRILKATTWGSASNSARTQTAWCCSETRSVGTISSFPLACSRSPVSPRGHTFDCLALVASWAPGRGSQNMKRSTNSFLAITATAQCLGSRQRCPAPSFSVKGVYLRSSEDAAWASDFQSACIQVTARCWLRPSPLTNGGFWHTLNSKECGTGQSLGLRANQELGPGWW